MENTMQLFLPICVESEYDIFFNIIKNAYGKLRLDSHYLDNALKSAMSGEIFSIKSDDLMLNWLEQKSVEGQIRQSKMLGYWAAGNFLALGKKFFGPSWQPPQRNKLQTDGHGNEVTADEIDAVVFKKLKIRLVELDVTPSTLQKMRHFSVNVPAGMAKTNELQLSAKAKSFDIEENYLEFCWNALKLGSHSSNSISGLKRKAHADEEFNSNSNNSKPCTGSTSVRVPKRTHLDTNTAKSSASSSSIATERVPLDKDTAEDTDPIKAVLLEIRNEVGELSDFVRSKFTASCSQSVNPQDSVHMFIINQKDEAIARLEATSRELLLSNQSLASEKSALKEHNDRQNDLIHALQKGVESTSKLQMQADQDLTGSLNLIESMKLDMTRLQSESDGETQKLREELEAVKQQMYETQFENKNLNDENQKLRDERQLSIDENSKVVDTLKQQITEMGAHADRDLIGSTNLIESVKQDMNRLQSESNNEIQKLREELEAVRQQMFETQSENKNLNDEKQKLRDECQFSIDEHSKVVDTLKQQITEMAAHADRDLIGSTNLIESLKQGMNRLHSESNSETQKLREELEAARQQMFETQSENKNLNDEKQKQHDERQLSIDNYSKEIDSLKRQMAQMENENRNEKEKNEKLRTELETLKRETDRLVVEMKSSLDEIHLSTLENRDTASVDTQTETLLETDSLLADETDRKRTESESNATAIDRNNMHTEQQQLQINNVGESSPSLDFVTDDDVVKKCRPILQKLQFGWMKFQPKKKAKFYPGFVHPVDEDKKQRAQRVTPDGYVSNTKNLFFEFAESIPDEMKDRMEISTLKKFNGKFNFSFV